MNKELTHFQTLYGIDCNDKTEKKNNGSVELTYLSWCFAWAEVKKLYPDAKYEILKFGEYQLPYVFDGKTGYMVFTRVEIEGITHEMWLPVMDSANKAMKDEPYTYKVKKKEWDDASKKYVYVIAEKTCEAATMFDINKTIMRCLTKNLAMFGLGLYIYAGEDLPESLDDTEKTEKPTKPAKKETVKQTAKEKAKAQEYMITDDQKKKIIELYSETEIKKILVNLKKTKLGELTLVEASNFIKEKLEEK